MDGKFSLDLNKLEDILALEEEAKNRFSKMVGLLALGVPFLTGEL